MKVALVIEDDQTQLDLLEERVLSMDHACRKARSQAEGVELLNSVAFDYFLLDLEIPSRSGGRPDLAYGLNLIQKIRQMPGHKRKPILVMTGHGLESHHLCCEAMKLGATDFLGKPFGGNYLLEDRIHQALLNQGASNAGVEATPARVTKFKGGEMVFYNDRVELCGVRICGGKNSSTKRRLLDLLCERNGKGQFRCFSIKDIADRLNLEREGAVTEAVSDFRRDCRERLRDNAAIDCEKGDVVSNQNRGYHFREWITVLQGAEEGAAGPGSDLILTDNQRGILRALAKHSARKPRKVAESLNLSSKAFVKELDALLKAGFVIEEGNGSSRKLRLAKNGESELPLADAGKPGPCSIGMQGCRLGVTPNGRADRLSLRQAWETVPPNWCQRAS